MSNRYNSPNHNEEDEDLLLDEEEQNPTNSGYICFVIVLLIPTQQRTRLAQPATDQRTIDPQELTNQQIDELIQRQPEHIAAAYWCGFILFHLLIYYCSPLLILALIIYWMTAYYNQPTMALPESQSHYSELRFNYAFNPYRDAEAEGRTANPTEEEIQFSTTVESLAPYGVQTALTNNIPHANVIINNDNGHINPIIENETIVLTTTNRNEEVNFGDNIQQRDPTPPTTVQNNVEINQTNTVHDRPAPTPLHTEVMETEGNTAPLTDGAAQALLRATRFTGPSPNGTVHGKSTS